MSMRVDSSLIAGSLVVGGPGLGVLAENVPSTGPNGAGYLYNDLTLPADNGKEVRGEILTQPSSGTLFALEDSSFSFVGAPDGSYEFTYQLYVDGVLTGPAATVTLNVGDVAASVTSTQSVQNGVASANSFASSDTQVVSTQAIQNSAASASSSATLSSSVVSTQAAQNSVSFATNFSLSDSQIISTQAAQNSALQAESTVPPAEANDSIFFVAGEIHNSLVLKAREPEFLFIYYTKFNLTGNTALALKLTDPHGTDYIVDATRLSAPVEDIATGDPATPTLSGGTYMQFSTTKTDFPFAGVWRVKGLYVEGDIERPGDSVYFVVGDSFYA